MTEDGLFVAYGLRMADNIWSGDWDSLGDNDWEAGLKSLRLPRGDGTLLGASVYELPPGAKSAYHFHHGAEELLIALSEGVTVRTPDGERVLAAGEAVFFAPGPGARTDRSTTRTRRCATSSPERDPRRRSPSTPTSAS
jgi:quercetin dioxygenase-like cupin family protein